uniref:Uncharacterized protein n=1 Tax=Branchiostoma floridae TaxID=7739 RepID=C3ZBG7_BRAFL|eukprot:XP_002594193.1 hypothetical protein BRAFLDRAFT_65041 [Branchiostoma floridae]
MAATRVAWQQRIRIKGMTDDLKATGGLQSLAKLYRIPRSAKLTVNANGGLPLSLLVVYRIMMLRSGDPPQSAVSQAAACAIIYPNQCAGGPLYRLHRPPPIVRTP